MRHLRSIRGEGLGTVSVPGMPPIAQSPPLPRAGRVFEITATGFDENLQATGGGDPYGGMSSVGLRVPTLATPNAQSRYLFLLGTFSIPARSHARIIGYRQLVSLGVITDSAGGPYVAELLVTSPSWRFPDGNVSWHMQRLGPPNSKGFPYSVLTGATPPPSPSFAFRFAQGSALLYEKSTLPGNLYVDLSAYTPPNQGRPWGRALRSGFFTFYDNHTAYDYGALVPMNAHIEGPETIGFFASLYQSNPSTRATLSVAAPSGTYTNGVTPEDQFLLNFPNAIYWRVGGSLLVELFEGE